MEQAAAAAAAGEQRQREFTCLAGQHFLCSFLLLSRLRITVCTALSGRRRRRWVGKAEAEHCATLIVNSECGQPRQRAKRRSPCELALAFFFASHLALSRPQPTPPISDISLQ